MPYPVPMPGLQDIANTFGVYNPETYQKARQAYDLTSAYNQQNLQDQSQAYQQRERTNPLDVQAKELANVGAGYNNEATRLGNIGTARKNEIDQGVPIDLERQYRISKYAKEMSDNDMKQLENTIQTEALSLDPQRRDRALKQMQFFKDVVAERDKAQSQHGYRMAEIGAQGANAENVARIGAESRESVAATRATAKGNGSVDFLSTLRDKYKRPDEKYGALLVEAKRIESENPELAIAYRGMAEEIKNLATARLGATPKAGTPDLDKLNIRANPTPDIAPPGQQAPAASPLARLQAQYPGTKDNGDGTFTLPDGRRVKPKGN